MNLSHNSISKIEGISALYKLEDIDLSGNRIQHIPKLPKLRALHTLRLAGNEIAALPEVSNLRFLPAISLLTIDGNPVAELEHTRSFAIYASKTLDMIDGQAVALYERREATERFARGLNPLCLRLAHPHTRSGLAAHVLSVRVEVLDSDCTAHERHSLPYRGPSTPFWYVL